MVDDTLLKDVRALRSRGSSPKMIARALGVRPAIVAPLVRQIAQEEEALVSEPRLRECWVSPGWSDGLGFEDRPEWADVKPRGGRPGGLAAVLVVRDHRGHRVSVCGYLVDVYCLGVKDTLGPRLMHELALGEFVRQYFAVFRAPPQAAPLELAQHLVLGAVEYARALGFEPSPTLQATRGHLGPWEEPSGIRFGLDGRPFFVQGPRDDAGQVLRTLRASVGEGNFHFSVAHDPGLSGLWEELTATSMV